MRRAVVAPDKFKGSLSARAAADAIVAGIGRGSGGSVDVRVVPMADGGEGTVDAFVDAGAVRVERRVRGPLGELVTAAFALDGRAAIVEMAAASGLALVPADERDPKRASTYGTGELVRAALDAGARRIVVAVGGSATNDGGAGFLSALGARLLDAAGRELEPGGAALSGLVRIDLAELDHRLLDVTVDVAADVDAPLLGARGASAVFGPQKGASAEDVRQLDAALAHYAGVVAGATGRDVRDEPGTGAAGGLAFALRAFLGAEIRPGVEVVAGLRGLPDALAAAWACFTGEGSIDAQTLAGKTVVGVARLAREAGVPVVAFGGRVNAEAEDALAQLGATAVPIVAGPCGEANALEDAAALLARAAARSVRLLLART